MHRVIKAHLLSIAIKEEAEKLQLIPRWIKMMQGTKWKAQMLRLKEATDEASRWSNLRQDDRTSDMEQLKSSIEQAKRMLE